MTVFPRIKPAVAWLGLLMAGLLLWCSPVSAQQTTGTVTGVVKDASGAVIPQATVVLTSIEDKSERKTVSNGDGEFSMASIAAGQHYRLTITMGGFQKWQSQPFPMRPGDRVGFTDIKMLVGEASAQVTVEASASQAVKPLDTPERSDVITEKDLQTLAIEGRDATELIETLPGFSLISPGVSNQGSANTATVGINNGITGGYSSSGLGATGLKTILDGVYLTDILTNAGTVQTTNPDMIQDVKVSVSNFSAANAQGPAIFAATTKSGTTSFHGSAYLYARDTVLNANDWYNNYLQQSRPDGSYFYPGGTIGGPLWIPGTRFTRNNNKLFFFAGLEFYNQKYSPETLGSWVPTLAERAGDFSVANLNAQLCGGRPDGMVNNNANKPMCNAENYLADGVAVPEGNVATFVDPLTGQAAANAGGVAMSNWLPLPNANPFNNLSGYNYIQPVTQTQNGDMFHARVDYSINDTNKVFATYGRQAQITQDPVALNYAPANSAEYPGGVTTGDISNIISVTYTHVFSPTITNEFGAALSLISDPGNLGNPAAVDRFDMNSYNCSNPSMRAAGTCGSSGNGNFDYLGQYKQAGDFSVPALNSEGTTDLGYPDLQMPGGFYADRVHIKKTVPDIQDSVSWQKGRHFLQGGVYYEKGIVNGIADTGAFPQGEYTFNPGTSGYDYSMPVGQVAQFTACENPQSSGTTRASGAAYLGECINPNAMMYTGTPDSFQQTNFTPIVDMQFNTLAGYLNDEWKIRRVTLVYGARIEHLGPWTDRHNNGLAVFSPSLYNSTCSEAPLSYVTCGASSDYPGITWHGLNSAVSNSVNNPATVYFSPRVGLSYDLFGHGNTVLRGGWGIYREEEEFAPYAQAAATAQGYKTTKIQNQYFNFTTVDEQAPINPSDFSVDVLSANDTVRPVYYEYNATVSQRLKWNSLLEVAYVGNNSQNLSSYNQGSAYNEASDVNVIPAGFMFGSQTTNGFCLCNLPTNLGAGSISALNTGGQDYFRPYPFYNHIYALKHDFYSNYNSVQVSWNKSSGHIQYGVNYTFSKALATAASYNNNIVDPVNLRNDYNPATFDRTDVFNSHYLVDFGTRYHGDHHLVSEAANGWQLSGITQYQSGVNLASGEGENFGFGYGTLQVTQVATAQQATNTEILAVCQDEYSVPNDSAGQHNCVTNLNPVTWLGTPDYLLMPTLHCNPAGGKATHQYINPTCFGVPLPGSPAGGTGVDYSNPTGQGVYRLPYLRGPAYTNTNLALIKNFSTGENKTLQFRAEAFNFLNHSLVSFNSNDNTNLNLGNLNYAVAGQPITAGELSSPTFGIANIKYGSAPGNGGRLIELGAKFLF